MTPVNMEKQINSFILTFITALVLIAAPHAYTCETKKNLEKQKSTKAVESTTDGEQNQSRDDASHEDTAEETEQVSDNTKVEDCSTNRIVSNFKFKSRKVKSGFCWEHFQTKHSPNQLFKPPIATLI